MDKEGDGNPVDAEGRPSYWLDACEDVSCDDYFVDFGASATTAVTEPDRQSQGGCNDSSFFGGIDQILDNIKNGGVDLPSNNSTDQHSVSKAEFVNGNGKRPSNGFKKDETYLGKRPHECYGSEQRRNTKVRGRDPKERKVWPGRKRQRGLDDVEMDGQVRDHQRRRERYSTGSWKDRDSREARGFWEREKETNELIFRVGSWESCRNKDEKANAQRSNKYSGYSEEKKPEQPKEKLPEEQARQYQLDVLEQAKKRNTIAFLETGAGKTLIAVLLMKSISTELQKLDKKMLAVFLVPKVPLVYQVVSCGWSVKNFNSFGLLTSI